MEKIKPAAYDRQKYQLNAFYKITSYHASGLPGASTKICHVLCDQVISTITHPVSPWGCSIHSAWPIAAARAAPPHVPGLLSPHAMSLPIDDTSSTAQHQVFRVDLPLSTSDGGKRAPSEKPALDQLTPVRLITTVIKVAVTKLPNPDVAVAYLPTAEPHRQA
ncbi:hypothetical protein J6590_058545 [Homalodisca vitripennis]|nr:hypothetical protein J6590_058545 [Homalodisca vitripennis]